MRLSFNLQQASQHCIWVKICCDDGHHIEVRTLIIRPTHGVGLKHLRLCHHMAKVCDAVLCAHQHSLVHRDLKPGNVMLGRHGETLVVDWGLAKPVGRSEASSAMAEARAELDRAGDEDGARALLPKKRVAMFIIDRAQPGKGPLLWAAPWTLEADISKASIDDGVAYPLDSPDEGYDVSFTREVQGKNVPPKYVAPRISRKPSPIFDDEEETAAVLQWLMEHPIPAVLLYHDYDVIQGAFEGGPPANRFQEGGGKKEATEPPVSSAKPKAQGKLSFAKKPAPEPEPEEEHSLPPRAVRTVRPPPMQPKAERPRVVAAAVAVGAGLVGGEAGEHGEVGLVRGERREDRRQLGRQGAFGADAPAIHVHAVGDVEDRHAVRRGLLLGRVARGPTGLETHRLKPRQGHDGAEAFEDRAAVEEVGLHGGVLTS